MPTVERVKSEIKGSDPIDTAARHMGAFWQLNQMVRALAGPRAQSMEFTPDENRYMGRYADAWQWYQYKDNAPPVKDRPRFFELAAAYETDAALQNELLQRFFPPDLRSRYQAATGKQPAAIQANAQPQTGTAVLSTTSGLAVQAGAANPLAGRGLALLKESFAGFLRRTEMFLPPPGSSEKAAPLAAWASSCRLGMSVCQQALFDAQSIFAGNAKMDASGKATFPGVPPGRYYVLVQALAGEQHLVWDLPVDLKPGANQVTLGRNNTAPLEGDTARAMAAARQAGSQPCRVADARKAPRPAVAPNATVSVIGLGYTYTVTDRTTGRAVSTEKGNFGNTTLYLLDEDADSILQQAGVGTGLLGSRLATLSLMDAATQVQNVPGLDLLTSILPQGGQDIAFGEGGSLTTFTKERQAEFECLMQTIRASSVAQMTTDANARGMFPKVPAGTYYLFGRFYRVTKPARTGGMFWNLRVEVKPGQNVVNLSVNNAALK